MKRTHVIQSNTAAAHSPVCLDFLFSQTRDELASVMPSIAATRD